MAKLNDIQLALSYDDVLLVPQYSSINSRNEVSLKTKISNKVTLEIPLITANMSDVTDVKMATAIAKLGGLGVIPRFLPIEMQANEVFEVKKTSQIVGAAVGARNGIVERAESLVKAGVDILFIDVAHGHMQKNIDATKKLKQLFGNSVDIVSGNTATFEATDDLFKAGADCVKVGVGPGSICTTRIETGSGIPQITAILEAAKAARKHKKFIIADGGIKTSGDVVKALAAGASAVMAGSIFAGCDESPGKIVKIKGKKFKVYNASTSMAEKKRHFLFNKKEVESHYIKQIEGVESIVPYKGSLSSLVERYVANIRSGLSYSGAENINKLWQNSKFVRITSQGLKESGSHDVLLYNTR
ncbi:MAG: IMP dehydrogenase [bacterium]|nr:MAG: IMP dehydrogenase [bacterium]